METPPLSNQVVAAPAKATRSLLDNANVLGWGSLVLTLLLWELLAWIFGVSALYLPRPSQIVVALITMFGSGGLLLDLVVTLWRIFGGFAIALVLGTLLGLWISTSFRTRAVADMFIAALYPLPKVTLIPLLIIWLGTGGPFMLTISFLGAIFPIVINTVLGVSQCDPGLVLAARDLGASQQQIMRRVLLPSAIPSIFAGMRLGAWRVHHPGRRRRDGGRQDRARRAALSRRPDSRDRTGIRRLDRARRARHRGHQGAGRRRHLAQQLAHRLNSTWTNRKEVLMTVMAKPQQSFSLRRYSPSPTRRKRCPTRRRCVSSAPAILCSFPASRRRRSTTCIRTSIRTPASGRHRRADETRHGRRKEVLDSVGATWTDVVKITKYLTDMRDADGMHAAMRPFFGDWKPASTMVCINQLSSPGARVELDMIVALPKKA